METTSWELGKNVPIPMVVPMLTPLNHLCDPFLISKKGGCQNDGPFLGTLNIGCRIIIGNPKRDHNFAIARSFVRLSS